MAQKIFLYPAWIRFWHLLNALLCLLLIVTGLSMHYSNPGALVGFRVSVQVHNLSGIILSLNYLIFLVGNTITNNGVFYRFALKGMIDRLFKQFGYYTGGLFKGEKAPFPINESRKFNPLQQFTYGSIMYMAVPLVIISGFIMLYPELILPHFKGLIGVFLTDLIHITMGFFISVFLIIHVYFCTIGHTTISNFKSMINGWHEVH